MERVLSRIVNHSSGDSDDAVTGIFRAGTLLIYVSRSFRLGEAASSLFLSSDEL